MSIEALIPWLVLVVGMAVLLYALALLTNMTVPKLIVSIIAVAIAGGLAVSGLFLLFGVPILLGLLFNPSASPDEVNRAVTFTATGIVGVLVAIVGFKWGGWGSEIGAKYLQKFRDFYKRNFAAK